jgi:hypothetical protein
MGMDVTLNPNPPDIQVFMDIHGFTPYITALNTTTALRQYLNNISIL